MKNHRQKDRSRPARGVVLGGTLIVVVLSVVAVLYFTNDTADKSAPPTGQEDGQAVEQKQQPAQRAPSQTSEKKDNTRSVTRAPSAVAAPDTLVGRWFRTDGNYVIEVVRIGEDGDMKAAYYNPRPIHVSKSEAYLERPLRIYIELQDAGYDGSSYNLTYDVGQDVLRGTYYQATYGQTYQVVFMRQETPVR